jgi:monoamine oxidase
LALLLSLSQYLSVCLFPSLSLSVHHRTRPDSAQDLVIHAQRVSWASDPFARGGVAHVRPGSGPATRRVLAAPEGPLFFAGEATALESCPGTVHGAIDSGMRAARQCVGDAKL